MENQITNFKYLPLSPIFYILIRAQILLGVRELEKEAKARIKINKLLEEADWRLLDEKHGKANVLLENHVKLTSQDLDAWGEDFERTRDGFIDFLLLDANGYPFVALEAKAENETLPPIITRAIDGKFSPKINTRLVELSCGKFKSLEIKK